ncbi:hypothetical protein DPMN_055567 [Dreissena polymorpha]|uniref:HAT C-terminal dimerisation domain-containing protein n=1 Tax=Dreissena polymorpha TaxID=45954 RepID=A0A9D4HST5_DREPO|nr:hypothetical protein DPMN_055567 [Dreissena polymorpha]
MDTYPHLAILSRKLSSVPATSVPSKRVFSAAGATVTKLRASLNSSSVDKLVFLHKSSEKTFTRRRVTANHSSEFIPDAANLMNRYSF